MAGLLADPGPAVNEGPTAPDGNRGWRFGVGAVRLGQAGHRLRGPADNSIGGDRFRLRWMIQVKRAEGCGCDLVNHCYRKLISANKTRTSVALAAWGEVDTF